MRIFSLALKFALELAAFAALAYWGATVSIVLAIAAPVLAIVLAVLVAVSTALLTRFDQREA